MSSIEKIKKINEMSAYLKQHGFASSSDDAALKAQEVFQEQIASPGKSTVKMAENTDTSKLERNFEVFKASIHSQIEAVKGDLSSVIGKMNEMIKVINELEKLKDSVTTIDEGEEKQQRLAPKVVKKPMSEKPASHPRSGDMKPGDVDLSKTFYFGKR